MAEVTGLLGLALTVPGLVQVCLQSYRFLSAALKDIQTTDNRLKQFTLFLDLSFSNLEETLTLVNKIESSLEPSTKEVIIRVLLELQALLATFASKLNNCYEKDGTSIRRIKFALGLKWDFEKFQNDIDSWNERLARRLFLRGISMTLEAQSVGKTADQEKTEISTQSDQEIQAPCLAPTELPKETLKHVDSSNAFVGQLPDGTIVVVEYRYFRQEASFRERMFVKYSVRDVATMLCKAHSRLDLSSGSISKGILECIGYFVDEPQLRYGLVSKLPTTYTVDHAPRSLQSLLCSPENRKGSRHDLNDRIVLARSIASAILAIHSAQFVHKSIRPSNILVLDPQEPVTRGYPYQIGRPVIIGFEETRPESEESEMLGTAAWEENIYRHPERQGLIPRVPYSMMHDIYSLGVIFTEIALWRSSLVMTRDKETGIIGPCHNPDFWGSLYETRRKEHDPEKIQSLYRKLARSAVPKYIGGRFAQVIESCLTCLDGGFDDAKGEDSDSAIGVAYIEKVVESLEGICL
jgi:hypothetical protein